MIATRKMGFPKPISYIINSDNTIGGVIFMDINNLIGYKFGKLTVIEEVKSKKSKTNWKCKCDCGNEIILLTSRITFGNYKSCGCSQYINFKPKVNNLENKRFGRLIAIKVVDKSKSRSLIWQCKCDCGNVKNVPSTYLLGGDTQSCGCLQLESEKKNIKKAQDKAKTHGMSKTNLFRRWAGMKQRCENINNNAFNDYGGRGIKICDEWSSFENFRDWSLNNGYKPNLSIDRINVNGNYEPTNCRWATSETQANNRRDTVYLTINKARKTTKEWSNEYSIKPATIKTRIKAGLIGEELLQPLRHKASCVICGDPMKGLGYCSKHYQQYKKYGDTHFK